MSAGRKQVQTFLTDFKKIAQHELNVIPREINRDFLTLHGFTPRERKEVILGLTVEDYIKGPEEDDRARGPKDIWFFGVEYESLPIYIKLQMVEEVDAATGQAVRHAKCISFHRLMHLTPPNDRRASDGGTKSQILRRQVASSA